MALDVTQFAITVDNKQAIKSIKVVEEALDTGLSKAARKADTHLQKIQENFGKIDRASNQFSNSVMKLSGTIFTLGAAKRVPHELWSAFSQFPETSKNMARLESSLQLLGNQLQTVFAPAVNIAADSLSRLLNKTDLPAWIDQAGTALATQTRIFEVTQQIRTLEGNRKRAGIKDFFLDFVGKGVDGDIARMDQRLQSLRATLADLQQNGLRANTAEPTTSASPALNQALADMARLNADLAAAERLRIPAGIALAEAGKQQIEVIKEQEEALKRLAVAADKAMGIHRVNQALADMARLNADLAAAERLRIPAGIALAEAGKQQIEVIKEQEEALKRLAVAADKAMGIHRVNQALADMARLNADLAAAERLRIPAGIALAEAGKQQIEVI